jgi:hypothetical protein
MAELNLDTSRERVAFIMDNIPQARYNYLLLLLSYWQLFDGIDIPEDVVKQIVDNGTQPETIARSRRKARELARYREILELQRLAQETELEEVE